MNDKIVEIVDQIAVELNEHLDTIDVTDALKDKLSVAIEQVRSAMALLIENGINPQYAHQQIAFAWARGEITEDEFLSQARLIVDRE